MKDERARLIGEKLRFARRESQLNLRELARKADISASMLSQIETGKAYPSVRSIYNIAAALDLPVDFFFLDQADGQLATVAAGDLVAEGELNASQMRDVLVNQPQNGGLIDAGPGEGPVLKASDRPTINLKGGVTWMRLTAIAEPQAEFLEVVYAAGASSGENMSHHQGRELGLILEGELIVQLGFEEYCLHQGDSIVFDSETPHRLMNKGDQPMRAMWAIWNQV